MNGKMRAHRQSGTAGRLSAVEGSGWEWDVVNLGSVALAPRDGQAVADLSLSSDGPPAAKVMMVVTEPGPAPDLAEGTLNPVPGTVRAFLELRREPVYGDDAQQVSGTWVLRLKCPDEDGVISLEQVERHAWAIRFADED
jgi:hypothetical protein